MRCWPVHVDISHGGGVHNSSSQHKCCDRTHINTGKHSCRLPYPFFLHTALMASSQSDILKRGILSRARTFLTVLGGVYLLIVLLLTVPFIQTQ